VKDVRSEEECNGRASPAAQHTQGTVGLRCGGWVGWARGGFLYLLYHAHVAQGWGVTLDLQTLHGKRYKESYSRNLLQLHVGIEHDHNYCKQ
jgi:hypothetical protein